MRFILFSFFLSLLSTPFVYAGEAQEKILKIIRGAGDFLGNIFLAVGVIIFLYSGFRYWQASGDPKKIGDAHQGLIWAIIGLAVGLLAKSAPTFIDVLLSGGGDL